MKQIDSIILILLVIAFSISCKNENNIERTKAIEYLQSVVELTNKSGELPRKVNEHTIAEKVTYNSDKSIITYSYILTDITPDIDNLNEVISSLKDIRFQQIKRAKNNQGNDKAYQLLKITISNIYKNSNGKEIYSFKIKPKQYLK